MSSVTISIIGAGSAVFSLRLVSDLCKTKSLSGSVVRLMDVDEVRLEGVHFLACRLADEMRAEVRFEKTTDLEAAISGSDFVINSALIGGHSFLEKMRVIGEKHGYYRGIDTQEFNMVADYYTLTNWNQFSFFLKIAKLIQEKAPNAWLLLAANPVCEGTTLISRESKIKMVGFCHGHYDVKEVGECVGLSMDELDWQVAGVNHNIWLTRFRHHGQDQYPKFDQWVKTQKNWKPRTPFDLQLSPVALDMYHFYGRMPIGDAVRNSTWKYNSDTQSKKRWLGEPWGGADSPEGWAWYEGKLTEIVGAINQLYRKLKAEPSLRFSDLIKAQKRDFPNEVMEDAERMINPLTLSGEQHIPFIAAVTNNQPTRLVVNTLNKGTIPELPNSIAVEYPAIVDKQGIHPEKIDPAIPERIVKWYLMPRILRLEWALEAFLKKDSDLIVEFLMRDPRTKSFEQAKAVVQEIMKENRT